jgi:peptidoglycan/LPS O-acetylase OafA/YrhL
MSQDAGPLSDGARSASPGTVGRPVSLTYVPGLDGLRAIAVLGVMLYHGGAPGFGGGFLGVNIFFVLSGFLITSLLLGEWTKRASIRLGQFWARRARRLLPALLLMLIAVSLYVRLLTPAGQFGDLRLNSISTLFYVANWNFIYSGGNYFDLAALPSPLVHMWSLSIEEQFYIVWPPVALVMLRLGRRLRPARALWPILATAAVGALLSAIEMRLLFLHGASVTRVYEGTDTRSQDILVGATLAIGMAIWATRRRPLPETPVAPVTRSGRRRGPAVTPIPAWEIESGPVRMALQVAGWASIGGGLYLWSQLGGPDPVLFKGGSFLFALGVALVLFCVVTARTGSLSVALANPVFRYIGMISYGTYLWHVPLFDLLDPARVHLFGLPLLLVRVVATLSVATISYYLVERPIRRKSLASFREWKTWLATAFALATVVAVVIITTIPVGVSDAAAASSVPAPSGPQYEGPPVTVTLFGDSLAFTAGWSIATTGAALPYNVHFHSEGILGCGVVSAAAHTVHGVTAASSDVCTTAKSTAEQWSQVWEDALRAQHPNTVLLMAGRWEVTDQQIGGQMLHIGETAYDRILDAALEKAVAIGTSTGAYMVLETAPCDSSGEQPNGEPWPEDTAARRLDYDRILRQVAARHPGTVTVDDFGAEVCPQGKFSPVLDGIRIRTPDGVHFPYTAGTDGRSGQWLASKLLPEAVRVGRLQMAHRPIG